MDICITDYENAALTVMVGMIANLVNAFDLDFIIPISKVDDNMERAHARNGLLE
jgi:glutamate--cysteine ligase catalytic subunit